MIQILYKEVIELYTVKDIADILNQSIINIDNIENRVINDFEYIGRYVTESNVAFVSISKSTWKKWLGKEPKIAAGNQQIKNITKLPALVITDEFISDLDQSIPQIVVEDAIEAMQTIGKYFRKKFNNPIIGITGSMGKSSTRMMIGEALRDYKILQNRGNANTRVPLLLNLCKLIKNPDFAIFEISINALNNRGNLSSIIKPNITVVTGIGEAHLSTIEGTEEIAEFKSRIFVGQSKNDIAIINEDTKHSDILKDRASQYVNGILTYSKHHQTINIKENKGFTTININNNGRQIQCTINTISDGMISNALATIQVLSKLNVSIEECVINLSQFKPFKKVLEIKRINTPHLNTTLIDDTHNASLPAMINAIEAFNKQSKFYKGNKIIVLGKISDLGEASEKIHLELVNKLEQSDADYILCTDEEMRKVVNRVKNKKITWYKDTEQLLLDLQLLINEDGLTLLKSSVTGTELPKVATRLFNNLSSSLYPISGYQYYRQFPFAQSDKYINKNNQTEYSMNLNISSSIEGFSPLIYYIYGKQKINSVNNITLKKWPTNDGVYFEGRKFKYNELVDSMLKRPHPSLIYQLADELFVNERERRNHVETFIRQHDLTPSSAVNVTGRFRGKERQTFTIEDLKKLYKTYHNELFKHTKYIVFGDKYVHGMIEDDREGVLIFSMYDSLEALISRLQ
ncbi:Mur ligase family protein [Staphylococcus aureus]|uniref:Mur ligase family protein n=1 Tax=Staphylococcus aureus TaxID=1280 RepID=UPI003F16E9A2